MRWYYRALSNAKIYLKTIWPHLLAFNGPVCIRKTLNVCAWGDKVPPCSVSNILDNWLQTVARVSLSCTAIQAESNELFGVIIKHVFVKIFRKFQRHCFRRFSRDVSCRGCGIDQGYRECLQANQLAMSSLLCLRSPCNWNSHREETHTLALSL